MNRPRPYPTPVGTPRCPLIYFNAGSTGVDDRFLPAVLRALAPLPYRLLVTHSRPLCGGSPVGQRADRRVPARPLGHAPSRAFYRLGGIGSIYHALAEGVPIIGGP